mgnify:CR=1 FL=1
MILQRLKHVTNRFRSLAHVMNRAAEIRLPEVGREFEDSSPSGRSRRHEHILNGSLPEPASLVRAHLEGRGMVSGSFQHSQSNLISGIFDDHISLFVLDDRSVVRGAHIHLFPPPNYQIQHDF